MDNEDMDVSEDDDSKELDDGSGKEYIRRGSARRTRHGNLQAALGPKAQLGRNKQLYGNEGQYNPAQEKAKRKRMKKKEIAKTLEQDDADRAISIGQDEDGDVM